MRHNLREATADDVAALSALHDAVSGDLTARFGQGPWSSRVSESGVRLALRTSKIFVTEEQGEIVATLRLATKKPWAIDTGCFTACSRPLYLLGMAVLPGRQRSGVGRQCLEAAIRIGKSWPADALRLDAYDANAGAGAFYTRCGWTEVGRAIYRGTPLIYFEFLLAPPRGEV